MFARFFRPKWQHAKAEVRLQAVQRLNPEASADQQILVELARGDSAGTVRGAAIERLTQPQALLPIVRGEQDPSIRQLALRQLAKTLSQSESPDSQLLEQITQQDLLVHLALHAHSNPLRQQALSKLQEDQDLLTLACSTLPIELRVQAAERIQGREAIEQLLKETQNNKRLQRLARDKLTRLKEAEKAQQQLQQQADNLCQSLASLSRTQWFPHYGAKLEGLKQQWQQLPAEALASNWQERFQQLVAACEQQILAQQAAETARLAEQQAAAAAQQAREQQQQAQHAFYQQLSSLTELDQPQLAEWQQRYLQLSTAWQELQTEPAEPESLRQIALALEHWQQYLHLQEALAAALQQPEVDTLLQLRKQLQWPTKLAQPALLQQLEQHLQQLQQQQRQARQQQRQGQQQLEAKLEQMARHLQAGRSKAASRIGQQLQQQLSEGESFPPALQNRLQQLQQKLQELLDWQGFALVPKKQELIAAMQALASQPQEPAQQLQRIRQLNQEWKALGSDPSPQAQTLWQAFREASDAAYAPCQEYVQQREQQKHANLSIRQQLCEQLQQFLSSDQPAQASLEFLEQLRQTARNQWQQATPVDKEAAAQCQQHFDQLMDQLSQQINAGKRDIEQAKTELLAAAEALLDWEDVQAATQEAKNIQQRWRELGQGRRRQEQALWARFRQCCDQLFAKRDEVRQQRRQERQAQQDQESQEAIQLLKQLQQLQQQGSLSEERLNECLSRWQQLPKRLQQQHSEAADLIQQLQQQLVKASYQPLLQALEQAYAVLPQLERLECGEEPDATLTQDTIPEALLSRYLSAREGHSELRMQMQQQEHRLLCIRMELLAGVDSPAQDQNLRMQYQLARLQDSMEQGHKDTTPLCVQMWELELEWLAAGPCADDSLPKRFQQALSIARQRY